MPRLHLLFCLAFGFAQTFAQAPIITQTSVEAAFTNSARTEYQYTIAPTTVNLGVPSGSPQTFNFAVIPGTTTAVDTTRTMYVPPAGQPGSSSFPTATSAGKFADSSGGQIITTVQYFRIQSDGAFFLGFAERIQLGGGDSTAVFIYNPPALFLLLPLTVNTIRTSSDTLDMPPLRRVTLRSFIGDGTLSLPNGNVVSAVRVITERTELSYFSGIPFSRQKTRDVEYYGADMSFAAFNGVDTLYTSGSTTAREFEYNVRSGSTSVRSDNESLPTRFALHQNYPNPFNPTTTIAFSLPPGERHHVSLQLIDLLGREISTLFNGMKEGGTHMASWDGTGHPSGVYIMRLRSARYVDSRQIVLMK